MNSQLELGEKVDNFMDKRNKKNSLNCMSVLQIEERKFNVLKTRSFIICCKILLVAYSPVLNNSIKVLSQSAGTFLVCLLLLFIS